MKFLPNTLSNALHRIGRARARDVLLRQDDRLLADAGFSRELLLEGVDAWPWRTDAVADAREAAAMRESQRRAIAELQAMDDRALADLDIARADIPRAVRRGRVGVERPVAAADRIAA